MKAENYTFNDFVVDESNRFAYAAALHITDRIGSGYNPLFLYGESGCGKSHLLCAMKNAIENKHPELKVLYITADDIVNCIIQYSCGVKDALDCINNADVLLVDNYEVLVGRSFTEFQVTKMILDKYEANKQVVLASCKEPKDYSNTGLLRMRCTESLFCDISSPTQELRREYLQHYISKKGVWLYESAQNYLCELPNLKVPELKGILNNAKFYYQSFGDPVDLEWMKELVEGKR